MTFLIVPSSLFPSQKLLYEKSHCDPRGDKRRKERRETDRDRDRANTEFANKFLKLTCPWQTFLISLGLQGQEIYRAACQVISQIITLHTGIHSLI